VQKWKERRVVCGFAISENIERVEGIGDSGRTSIPLTADSRDSSKPLTSGGPFGHCKDSSEVSRDLRIKRFNLQTKIIHEGCVDSYSQF
jgi:hypothetical protein